MQRRRQKEGREPRGWAPPAPDPRHPEAVLDTVPRAAGIDVHKMSLTCTVLGGERRRARGVGDAAVPHLRRGAAPAGRLAGGVGSGASGDGSPARASSGRRCSGRWPRRVWRYGSSTPDTSSALPGRKTDVSDSQWLATLGALRSGQPELRGAAAVGGTAAADAPARAHAAGGVDAAQHAAPDAGRERPAHRGHPDGPVRAVGTQPAGRSGGRTGSGADGETGVKGKARKKIPALLDALGCGLDEGAKPLVVLCCVTCRTRSSGRWRTWSGAFRMRPSGTTSYPLDAAADAARDGAAGRGRAAGRTGRRHGGVRYGAAAGELGGHVPGQPRVGGQEQGRKAAQGQRVSAAHPLRGGARRGAHRRRAVRALQAGPRDPARHGAGGRGDGAQDPAHRVPPCSATASRTAIRRSTTRRARRSRTRRAG